MAKALLHIALFVTGLSLSAAGIRELDRLPFWSFARRKMAHLAEHLEDYDTLFIGSSRIDNGIMPQVFDAVMHTLGGSSHSFNAAIPASRPHDFAKVVDWVLEQRPHRLLRVFIEAHSFEPTIGDDQFLTEVSIEGHTTATLPGRLRTLLRRERGSEQLFRAGYRILVSTACNHLRIGQGPRILEDLVRTASGRPLDDGGVWHEAGFVPISPQHAEPHRVHHHEQWIADPATAARVLEDKKARLIPRHRSGGFDIESVRAQVDALVAAGIEVDYIVVPEYSTWFPGRDGLADIPAPARLFDLDDPIAHPELFAFELFFDRSHYLRDGAQLLTAVLAIEYDKRKASGR